MLFKTTRVLKNMLNQLLNVDLVDKLNTLLLKFFELINGTLRNIIVSLLSSRLDSILLNNILWCTLKIQFIFLSLILVKFNGIWNFQEKRKGQTSSFNLWAFLDDLLVNKTNYYTSEINKSFDFFTLLRAVSHQIWWYFE